MEYMTMMSKSAPILIEAVLSVLIFDQLGHFESWKDFQDLHEQRKNPNVNIRVLTKTLLILIKVIMVS